MIDLDGKVNKEYQVIRDDLKSHVIHGTILYGNEILFPITSDLKHGDILQRIYPNKQIVTFAVLRVNHIEHEYRPTSVENYDDFICATVVEIELTHKEEEPIAIKIDEIDSMILNTSKELFNDGYYNEAVLKAFKKIESRVQQISGSSESGQSLMSKTFGKDSILDMSISENKNSSNAENERDGFKFLLMGAMAAIRNPRAHGEDLPDLSEQEALEYLGFASLLMRRINLASTRA